MRPSLLPRIAAALLAIQLPVAVVAALVHDDGDGGGRPDTEAVDTGGDLLAEAADRSAAATHYRYEMDMRFEGPGLDGFDAVVGEGAQAAGRSWFRIDQSALAELTVRGVSSELSMEIIIVETTQYLRAPMFASLPDGMALPPSLQPLAELGERWGRIDLAAVGAASGVPPELTGPSSMDPQGMLAMVRAVDGAEASGTAEVRGVPVTTYAAAATFDQIFGTEGLTLDDLRTFLPTLPAGISEEQFATVFEAMASAPLDVVVAIDGDGLVRRVSTIFGKAVFEAIGDATGEPMDVPDVSMTQTIEFFDYGDQSIVIDVPPIEETVDLTAWALEMADAFS